MQRFFLILPVLFILNCAIAQKPDFKFNHLTGANGLSQTHAIHMAQDHKGFIWIGTQNGLNKFDGYEITVYKHDPEDSGSLSSNHIRYIFEDSKNNLWIGTTEGVNLYDRERDRFVPLRIPADLQSYNYLFINTIFEDSKENLWIGTGGGIFVFDRKTESFIRYIHNPEDENSLSNNDVFSFAEDAAGNIWIGTFDKLNLYSPSTNTFEHFGTRPENQGLSENNISSVLLTRSGVLMVGTRGGGINIFNPDTKTFQHYRHTPGDNNSLGNDEVFCLYEDRKGNIWIGTENGGLDLFDLENETFYHYLHDVYDPHSIINNSVPVVFEDVSGNLWVGTHNGGVSYGHPYQSDFRQYKQQLHKNSVSHNHIKAFLEDRTGNIWIGTDGGGLNKWDRTQDTFTHIKTNPGKNSLGNDVVIALYQEGPDKIWIGKYGDGLTLFDKAKNVFTHYRMNADDPESLSSNTIWDIEKDEIGNIWLATREGGISILDKETGKFRRFLVDQNDDKSLSSLWTICLFKDAKNDMWIGTYEGLNLYEPQTNTFKRFLHDAANPHTISHNQINNIYEDKKGNLWIATPAGLNLFDRRDSTFTAFTQKDGLPSDLVQSIQEDDRGSLWLSTINHIVKFNPETREFSAFLTKHGDSGNEFVQNVSLKTKNGEILFGGLVGFNIFHPDSIKSNEFAPPVYFTDFQIFNRSIRPGENSPLKKNINEAEHIILSYNESVFSFEFAALNYISTERNQYAYMMEGFDKDWNYAGTRRSATYTNLDPGDYIFRIKASNNDGVWNEQGAFINITIVPPFWNTWWFRFLAFLMFIGSISLLYTVRINAIKKQKAIVEEQVKVRTAELVAQKEELASQTENLEIAHRKLEQAHTDIKDSIRAAQLIQRSILPATELIQKHLPEHFIFYRPKDVVSGDFYWFDVVDDKMIIAAVDCTGHGVSGAFMSINGHHLLNNAIYPCRNLVASEILDRLNDSLIKELHQSNAGIEMDSGMDIALCIIDRDTGKLQYAGANNPLYILRNKELIQIEANRKPIGYYGGKLKGQKFDNKIIDLQKNDVLYIFSDGYADQTGGPRGMKFMYPQFRKLLTEAGEKNMHEQLQVLDQTLTQWMGKEEQLDDILVIGFKII